MLDLEAAVAVGDSRGRSLRALTRLAVVLIAMACTVWDHGQRHFAVFDLRSGEHRPAIAWSTTWPPDARASGDQITASAFDAESQTALVRLAWSGAELGREGVLPEVARRQPILLQGGFHAAPFTEVDSLVFAAFELSPGIHRWTRGARTAVEIAVPAVRRRGVRPDLFEELLRDPSKAPQLMFDRSVPVLLEQIAPGILAFVTVDLRQVERTFASTFHVSLIDLQGQRVCVDLPVPTPELPRPALALSGDTLVILQQLDDPQTPGAATIRRFVIDHRRCPWQDQ